MSVTTAEFWIDDGGVPKRRVWGAEPTTCWMKEIVPVFGGTWNSTVSPTGCTPSCCTCCAGRDERTTGMLHAEGGESGPTVPPFTGTGSTARAPVARTRTIVADARESNRVPWKASRPSIHTPHQMGLVQHVGRDLLDRFGGGVEVRDLGLAHEALG